MKINPYNIDIDVVGWNNSNGKSCNVWGMSHIPKEILTEANKAKLMNRKSCIFTCYDDAFYANELYPETISVTLKPTMNKYTAVVESLAMKIALALDLPTAYNYIVKFDTSTLISKQILQNMRAISSVKNVQPYANMVIDFLKYGEQLYEFNDLHNIKEPNFVKDWITLVNNNTANILVLQKAQKTTLVKDSSKGQIQFVKPQFEDYNSNSKFKRRTILNAPLNNGEEEATQIKKINSRMVRTYLFREFVGDADFTYRNTGLVFNKQKKTVKYAPNYDYGECFNAIIKNKMEQKLNTDTSTMSPRELNNYMFIQRALKSVKPTPSSKPMSELASGWSSAESFENICYIIQNFPEDVDEFYTNLDKLDDATIKNLVYSYNNIENGEPLLTKDECELFIEFITLRKKHFQDCWKKNRIPTESSIC